MPRLGLRTQFPLEVPFRLNRASPLARGLVFSWIARTATAEELVFGSRPVSGSATPAGSPFGPGNAFNGTSQELNYGDRADWRPGTSPLTISVLANPISEANARGLITKRHTSGAFEQLGFYSNLNEAGSVAAGKINLTVIAADTTERRAASTSAVIDGGFHEYTWVVNAYANGGFVLYIDGVPQAVTDRAGGGAPNYTGTDPLVVGSANATAFHNQTIVRANYWLRALSPQEVWQLAAPQTRRDLYLPPKWRTIVQGTAGGDVTVTPGVVALSLGAPAATPTIQALPGAVAASLSVLSPTPVLQATPGAVALALNALAAIPGIQANPSVVALLLSVLAPTIQAGGSVTVSPSTVALALSVLAPSPTIQVAPGVVALALLALGATPAVKATPGTVALLLAALAPTVSGPGGVTATPGTVALVLSALAATPGIKAQPSTVALVLQVLALAVGQQAARARPTNRGQAVAGPTDRSY